MFTPKKLAMALVAATTLVAGSASAQFGRPDLPDVGFGSNSFQKLDTADGRITVAQASSVYNGGSGTGSHIFYADLGIAVIDGATDEIVSLSTTIDVPDRVKRKINRQVLNQKAFLQNVNLQVQTEGGFVSSGFGNTSIAGCKSRVRLDDFNPGRFRYETADIKSVCDQAALESLIVFPAARETAQRLLGTKNDGTGLRREENNLTNTNP